MKGHIIFNFIVMILDLVGDMKELGDDIGVHGILGIKFVQEFDGVINELVVWLFGVLVGRWWCVCVSVGGGGRVVGFAGGSALLFGVENLLGTKSAEFGIHPSATLLSMVSLECSLMITKLMQVAFATVWAVPDTA